MKRTLSLLLIAILLSSAVKAQNYNTQFVAKMNKLFQQIDKSQITSGLLSDYALELVDILTFNGIPADSNYITPDTWLNLYSTVYNAKINNFI